MLLMFFFKFWVKKFIQNYGDKRFQIIMENSIHKAHKDTWCIGYPKWHHQKLIISISSSKYCLTNVLSIHAYMMISLPKFNLKKDHRFSYLINQVIYPWKIIHLHLIHLLKYIHNHNVLHFFFDNELYTPYPKSLLVTFEIL